MKAKKIDQLYEYPADFFLLLESFDWERWRYQIRELLELCDTDTNYFDKNGPPLIEFFELYLQKKCASQGPEKEAASLALESIGSLKNLLKDKRGFKVLLLTVDMLTNFMRSGSLADLARQGANHSDSQAERRNLRATWAGMTKDEIERRNKDIVAAYQKAHLKNPALTPTSFALSNAKKYNLKSGTMRKIIKKAVGI